MTPLWSLLLFLLVLSLLIPAIISIVREVRANKEGFVPSRCADLAMSLAALQQATQNTNDAIASLKQMVATRADKGDLANGLAKAYVGLDKYVQAASTYYAQIQNCSDLTHAEEMQAKAHTEGLIGIATHNYERVSEIMHASIPSPGDGVSVKWFTTLERLKDNALNSLRYFGSQIITPGAPHRAKYIAIAGAILVVIALLGGGLAVWWKKRRADATVDDGSGGYVVFTDL